MPNKISKPAVQAGALLPKRPILQFPSIFRSIPERSPLIYKAISISKIILAFIISSYLLSATQNQIHLLRKNREGLKKIIVERKALEGELAYWKKTAHELKNYPDAYLKIAALEYRLGNIQNAKLSLNEALSINPNLEKGKSLQEEFYRRLN
jgi:tetratricopeptide (TPR) repeat protein